MKTSKYFLSTLAVLLLFGCTSNSQKTIQVDAKATTKTGEVIEEVVEQEQMTQLTSTPSETKEPVLETRVLEESELINNGIHIDTQKNGNQNMYDYLMVNDTNYVLSISNVHAQTTRLDRTVMSQERTLGDHMIHLDYYFVDSKVVSDMLQAPNLLKEQVYESDGTHISYKEIEKAVEFNYVYDFGDTSVVCIGTFYGTLDEFKTNIVSNMQTIGEDISVTKCDSMAEGTSAKLINLQTVFVDEKEIVRIPPELNVAVVEMFKDENGAVKEIQLVAITSDMITEYSYQAWLYIHLDEQITVEKEVIMYGDVPEHIVNFLSEIPTIDNKNISF